MQYNEIYKDCDEILNYLIKQGGSASQSDLSQVVSKTGSRLKTALDQLEYHDAVKRRDQTSSYYDIQPEGRTIYDKGGFNVLIDSHNRKAAEEKELAELVKKKTKIDLANAERVYKSYWFTFAMAALGLIISIVLLILKLREPSK